MKLVIKTVAAAAIGIVAAVAIGSAANAASMVEYAGHVSPNASMVEYGHISPNASMVEYAL